jgi:hypothetical protein
MSSILNCVKSLVLQEEQAFVTEELREKQVGHLEDKVDPKIARILAIEEVLTELYEERSSILEQVKSKIAPKTKTRTKTKCQVGVEQSTIKKPVSAPPQLKIQEVTKPPGKIKVETKNHDDAVSKIVDKVQAILQEKAEQEAKIQEPGLIKSQKRIVVDQSSIIMLDDI